MNLTLSVDPHDGSVIFESPSGCFDYAYKRDYLHVWMAKEPILAMSKVAKKSIPLHPKEKNTVKQYHSEEDFTRSATGIKNMKNYLAQMLKDFEKHKFPITKEGVVRIAKDRFDKHTHTHNRKHS